MFDDLDKKPKPKPAFVSQVDVLRWTEEAQKKWMEENTEEKIKKRVWKILDKRTEDVIAKILGFEHRWGDWQVDNCNGRSNHTDAGRYLTDVCGITVKAWLEAQGADLENIKLPKNLLIQLKKEILSDAKRQFKRELERMVITKLEEYSELVLNEMVKDGPYDVMQQLKDRVEVKDESSQ